MTERRSALALSYRSVFWSAVTLAGAAGLSVVVGFVGSEHGFGWELAAVFGTALGTTLLAISTGLLALLTARDVSAAQELAQLTRDEAQRTQESLRIAGEQAEIARAALDAQTEPFLTVGSVAKEVLSDSSAQVRNVGNATAIVTQAFFVGAEGVRFAAAIPDPAVPPGETTAIQGWPEAEDTEWLTNDNFSVVALYADVSGRERGAVRLDVYRGEEDREPPYMFGGPRRCFVTQVHWANSVEQVIAEPRVSSQRLSARDEDDQQR
jgi:hypothetical protein